MWLTLVSKHTCVDLGNRKTGTSMWKAPTKKVVRLSGRISNMILLHHSSGSGNYSHQFNLAKYTRELFFQSNNRVLKIPPFMQSGSMQIPPQYIILGPYKKTDIVIDSWFKLFEFSRQLHLLSNERFVFVTGTRVMRYLRLIFCSLVLKPECYSKGPNTLSHLRLSSIAAAGKSSFSWWKFNPDDPDFKKSISSSKTWNSYMLWEVKWKFKEWCQTDWILWFRVNSLFKSDLDRER